MRSERGNIVIYLLVSLVFFGLLLTGMWWVKKQAARTMSVAPTTTQKTDKKPEVETKISQDDVRADKDRQTASDATVGANSTPPADTGRTSSTATTNSSPSSSPATTPQPLGGGPTASSSPSTTPPPESQMPHVSSTGPSNVASSGPVEDALLSSTVLGGVVYVGVLFARSRQAA